MFGKVSFPSSFPILSSLKGTFLQRGVFRAVLREHGGERDGLFGTDSCNYGGEQSSFIFIDQVPLPLRGLSLSHYRLLQTLFANLIN